MRIVAIFRRWIETLATVFVTWHERQREQHALTVAVENQQVVVREPPSVQDITRPHVQSGQQVSDDLLRAAFVVLEFPADKVVRRDITVPAQARKFLSGVIRNQIERLSPWPPNNVVYGFSAEASGENASVIDVRILMASRTDIDASRHHLTTLGVQVDRIVANGSTAGTADEATVPVTLWSRSTDASRDRLKQVSRLIVLAIGVTAAMSMCLSLWALVSTGLVRDESEGIAARAQALQRRVEGGRTPSLSASLPPAERAWFLKETSISSMILIESLSRALPDSAYLTEIRLESATLRIIGVADDAPGLLAPLERSGHLTGVHFFAPTTRELDGKSFRFSIEAHVEPRNKIAGE